MPLATMVPDSTKAAPDLQHGLRRLSKSSPDTAQKWPTRDLQGFGVHPETFSASTLHLYNETGTQKYTLANKIAVQATIGDRLNISVYEPLDWVHILDISAWHIKHAKAYRVREKPQRYYVAIDLVQGSKASVFTNVGGARCSKVLIGVGDSNVTANRLKMKVLALKQQASEWKLRRDRKLSRTSTTEIVEMPIDRPAASGGTDFKIGVLDSSPDDDNLAFLNGYLPLADDHQKKDEHTSLEEEDGHRKYAESVHQATDRCKKEMAALLERDRSRQGKMASRDGQKMHDHPTQQTQTPAPTSDRPNEDDGGEVVGSMRKRRSPRCHAGSGDAKRQRLEDGPAQSTKSRTEAKPAAAAVTNGNNLNWIGSLGYDDAELLDSLYGFSDLMASSLFSKHESARNVALGLQQTGEDLIERTRQMNKTAHAGFMEWAGTAAEPVVESLLNLERLTSERINKQAITSEQTCEDARALQLRAENAVREASKAFEEEATA